MAVLAIAAIGGELASTVGLSFSLGFSIFGTIAELLLAPHAKTPTFKAATSAWGETWPITYNNFRCPGKLIQASDITEHSNKSKKGGPTFSQTIAFGFCEGPRAIGRIWADNQVIYDPRPITPPAAWQATHTYGAGDIVMPTSGGSYQFIAVTNGVSGGSEPAWNRTVDEVTRDGTVTWLAAKYVKRKKVGQQYGYTLRIYKGDEAQLADPALEEIVGTGKQMAYRGLCYIVLENFDLSRYGNRIPNIEAEILGSSANEFVSGAVLYGAPFGSNSTQMPLLYDDGGNYYGIGGTGNPANIKTLAITTLSTARINADAATLGSPYSLGSGYTLVPLAGKYLMALGLNGGPYGDQVVLYEINSDGTATALGCRFYNLAFGFDTFRGTACVSTIRPDTGEVMVCYGTFSTLSACLEVLDTIANMTGGYASRPFSATRQLPIPEITGDYAVDPGPWTATPGYCMGFVGSNLYFALNKAHMDFVASHSPGDVGYNTYYASLQALHPNGAMVLVETTSDNSGGLSRLFLGPVADYSWPFSDEGKNKAGHAGQTTTKTYDDWSPPQQVQEITGTVDSVWFTRGYSDVANEVGFIEFDGAQNLLEEFQGAPFSNSYSSTIDEPRVQIMPDGNIYLTFLGVGGQNYALLGAYKTTLMTLADICADISGRIGLLPADYDYAGLSSVTPLGCALLNRDTARNFLESLQPAFFYDLVDIGAQVVGTLRANQALSVSIPEDDLGASAQMDSIVDKIQSTRTNDIEIPQDMAITYYDYMHDYQQGSQQSRRNKVTNFSSGRNTITVPVVMMPGAAADSAERSLYLTWIERTPRKFNLSLKYVGITPADIVSPQRTSRNYFTRVTKATLNPTQVIDVEGVSEDLGVYSLHVPYPAGSQTAGGFTPQTINPIVTPILAVLDTASLRPDELSTPGTYVAGAASEFGGGWDGEFVDDSQDGSTFDLAIATLSLQATMGTASTTLGDPVAWPIFDRVNSVTVVLANGTLNSASEDSLVQNLTNLCWLSNGEIFQFATATPNGSDSQGRPIFILSDLLRGRFGTESFVGNHGPGETFVYLDETVMQTISYSASVIGATRYWRGRNDAETNPTTPVQTLVMATRRLLPFAPYFIKGARDGGQNLTITGLRRTRWRGRPLWSPAATDSPITVEIDVLNGSTVVRTLSSTLSANGSGVTDANGFTAVYKAADQVIDFGSAQASISLKAYALNPIIGRGYPGSKSV